MLPVKPRRNRQTVPCHPRGRPQPAGFLGHRRLSAPGPRPRANLPRGRRV